VIERDDRRVGYCAGLCDYFVTIHYDNKSDTHLVDHQKCNKNLVVFRLYQDRDSNID